ncbi:hypothetical protein N3K66_006244 [Trichothecium roseum]|uniref:Uncharacterized protein n=1 Tax=Trichothecium roseum TaxID=47278 RepID=A0ACC0V041_9HYPO|nr:hypothetical protein N3K66_006244 [Trichothecium roseum]
MPSEDVVLPEWVSFTSTWHSKPYAAISPERAALSAAGKNVVVTGGGTGIGRAVAVAFAQAGAASVSVLGRRADRLRASRDEILRQAADPDAIVVLAKPVDLRRKADVDAAIASIVAEVGALDILVNNAGAMATPGPATGYDSSEFARLFETNVVTTVNAVQAFLAAAREEGPGAMVLNDSAALAHVRPMLGASAYACSKAAQLKAVDYFAAENPGFHFVSFHPGLVKTEIQGDAMPGPGQDEVELPAHFCVWLASSEAAFLKNKFAWANWDVEELRSRAEEIEETNLLTVGLDGVSM